MSKQLGPYELKHRIAVGGLAEIFLAERGGGMLGVPQRFAVKVLLPQHAQSKEHQNTMVEEARLVAQLDHPNIVKVHDLGQSNGTLYMVMDYVEGLDLSKVLKAARQRGMVMPIDAAVFIAAELCAGLHYAHTRTTPDGRSLELVHRDVSPQNVLLGTAGEVKLIDFGVAKTADTGRMDTKTGIIKGKLAYMAPEYAIGALQDPRSDIFSAGLCLYEMITGRTAYDFTDPAKLIEGVKTAKMASPKRLRPETPSELVDLMSRALKRSPHDRYPTAEEMQHALMGFLGSYSPGFTRSSIASLVQSLAGVPTTKGVVSGPLLPQADVEPDESDADDDTAAHPGLADLAAPDDPTEANHGLAALAGMVGAAPDDPTEANHGLADLADFVKSGSEAHSEGEEDIAILQTVALGSEEAATAVRGPQDAWDADDDDAIANASTSMLSGSLAAQFEADMPTSDLSLEDLDAQRYRRASASTSNDATELAAEDEPTNLYIERGPLEPPDDEATATDIDVSKIRGDEPPRILSQSGFVRMTEAAQLSTQVRGRETMPAALDSDPPAGFESERTHVGTPPGEDTEPTRSTPIAELTAGVSQERVWPESGPIPQQPSSGPIPVQRPTSSGTERMPVPNTTTAESRDSNVGSMRVSPADESSPQRKPKPPTAAIRRKTPPPSGKKKRRSTLEKLRASIDPTDWTEAEAAVEKKKREPTETMRDSVLFTGRQLADRGKRRFDETSQTEPGRRRNDAIIVGVLGLVFVAIIIWTMFFAAG